MEITLANKLTRGDKIVAVPLFEDVDFLKTCPPEHKKILIIVKKEKDFKGEAGQMLDITPVASQLSRRLIFVGLGKSKKLKSSRVRGMAADVVKTVKKYEKPDLSVYLPADLSNHVQELSEGLALANYNPAKYQTGKTKKKNEKRNIKKIRIISPKRGETLKKAIKKGLTVAKSVNNVRDLINAPHNFMDGDKFARKSQEIAKKNHMKITVLNKNQLKKLKMGALLAVNKGSTIGAKLIIVEHKPATRKGKKDKPIVLVGKGITFDSGGYNLKTGSYIKDMKMDMSGAAVVLGIMDLCRKMDIKSHIIGVMPVTDNLIGAEAQKADDIITSFSGKTIEVNNTDAEGRLVLADAISYAIKKYKPQLLIDMATLTGACVAALGEKYAGLFGNDKKLIDRLKKAGEETDELAWHMPIHADHSKQMKSKLADLQNVDYGTGGMAGASKAAAFLQEFVGKTTWAHLDIAGTAFVKHPKKYESPMGTGYGVRLIIKFLEGLK